MSAAIPSAPYETTQDERTMATLAHVLQIVCSWIAPLIIFLVKRDSPFVKFHALQALILQICVAILWIVGIVIFMVTMAATMSSSGATIHNQPPPAVFFEFPNFWVVGMSAWVVVLIVAIVYGIKAGRGEWAAYPVIGNLARHLLKM
jgi:uncharacterized membrane protein